MNQRENCVYLAVPEPPFIKKVVMENEPSARLVWLAWYIVTRMSKDNVKKVLSSMKGPSKTKLLGYITWCRAWYWLCTYSEMDIRQLLKEANKSEVEGLRAALNALRPEYKKYVAQADIEGPRG